MQIYSYIIELYYIQKCFDYPNIFWLKCKGVYQNKNYIYWKSSKINKTDLITDTLDNLLQMFNNCCHL